MKRPLLIVLLLFTLVLSLIFVDFSQNMDKQAAPLSAFPVYVVAAQTPPAVLLLKNSIYL